MTTRIERIAMVETPKSLPKYELRLRAVSGVGTVMEIWHLPSPASPQITSPVRVAGLHGRNLELVEHRILKRLSHAGVKLASVSAGKTRGYTITEDLALVLGLLFRALAPMRSRENMRAVAEGIETMGREEAAYWLGMAMHRKNPRRVLTALRFLLTEPKAVTKG